MPPSAATMRISDAERGDHDRLDGVQPVLGLVKDDRRGRLEDLVGDLERVRPYFSKICRPSSVSVLCNAGRQCRNFTSGLPVASMRSALT